MFVGVEKKRKIGGSLRKKVSGNVFWYPLLCVFQECESSLKEKTELIGRLEGKAAEMAETMRNLKSQYVFQGHQSPSEPPQRARSKSYYEPPAQSEEEQVEREGGGEEKGGVGKSVSMCELKNRAAEKL